MSTAIIIAAEEWRYWFRTKLAFVAAVLSIILVCISVFSSLSLQTQEKNTRESLQIQAEETFRSQPARHPHRMVHYGHYVFRTPTALAALDPGVDPYTGTVMFLEGHRQNSAAFSPSYDAAQAGPFSRLTPALSYQILVPLVLIVIGFGMLAREREAVTDRLLVTSGISPVSIWLGKSIALLCVALLLLIPMLIGVVLSNSVTSLGIGFLAIYSLYLITWVLIISAVSTWSRSSSASLLVLLALWTVFCVLLPRLMASTANSTIPITSQIESDMDALIAKRALGDGHNANDPAFNQLKANLLNKYSVERVEDLPINFRGAVASASESSLTAVLNEHAEKRMAKQVAQTDYVKSFQFTSPFLILQSASMIAAGTDGKTHHRFLREAEAVRFEFIQGLNKAHQEKLNYVDDINRSNDEDSSRRARVSAENWRVLHDFRFEADPAKKRLQNLSYSFLASLAWILIFAIIGLVGARRLPETDHG